MNQQSDRYKPQGSYDDGQMYSDNERRRRDRERDQLRRDRKYRDRRNHYERDHSQDKEPRPSATSEAYSGPTNAVSIHNLIERQNWEHRHGLSKDFDPERRGHQMLRRAETQYDRRCSSRERDYRLNSSEKDGHRSSRTGLGMDRTSDHHASSEFEYHESRHTELEYGRVGSRKREHSSGDGHRRSNHRPSNDGLAPSSSWTTVPSQRTRDPPQQSSNDSRETAIPQVSYIPPTGQRFQPFLLLLVGIPGSGKSTFAEALQTAMPYKYVRVNQDTLGSRHACEKMAREVLKVGKCPVIDRCNFNPLQRKSFLKIASVNNVHVDCVVFTYPMEECVRRCENRPNHETVSPREARTIVGAMIQQFSPPLPNRINSETFRTLRNVSDTGTFHDLVWEYLNSSE